MNCDMPSATAPRISTRMVASLLAAWREMGLDTDVIVRQSGVSPDVLANPDAYLSPEHVGMIGISAYALSGDPLLGLHTAEHYRPGSIPVVDYLVLSAPTLRGAVERYIRYDRLLQNVSVTTLEISEGRATLRHEATGLMPPNPPATENALASAVVFSRYLTGSALPLLEARFAHAAPGDTSEYDRVFRTRVLFGQRDNAVVFPAELLDLPLGHTDSGVAQVLQRHADELLLKLGEDNINLTARVRRAITTLLPNANASLPKVAAELHLGERTLRRRLREEGTAFREVLEGVQHEMAQRMLRDQQVAVEELALILGFSDARAFRRAFGRWQGMSPLQFRRSAGQRSHASASH